MMKRQLILMAFHFPLQLSHPLVPYSHLIRLFYIHCTKKIKTCNPIFFEFLTTISTMNQFKIFYFSMHAVHRKDRL